MNNNTLTLRDSGLQNTRDIINEVRDFKNLYQQDKMDRLTAENLALKGQISQSNQNAYFAATLQAQTAPLGNALGDLSSRLAKIECNQPEVAKVPYSPVVDVYKRQGGGNVRGIILPSTYLGQREVVYGGMNNAYLRCV